MLFAKGGRTVENTSLKLDALKQHLKRLAFQVIKWQGWIHSFFLILKFKFKFIDFEKTKFKFKFIDFEKTKFKFIDFAKFEFKFEFKFINNSCADSNSNSKFKFNPTQLFTPKIQRGFWNLLLASRNLVADVY